jgi:hypothetical protein
MSKCKLKIKLTDKKKSTIKGLEWDKKRGVWNLETVNKKQGYYKLYGGITSSKVAYKPYQGWIKTKDSEAYGNFKEEVDAMAFVEKYYDKDFYI